MANQIVDAIEKYPEHDNYLGVFDVENIYEVLRYICEHYSAKSANNKVESLAIQSEGDKFLNFLKLKEIKGTNQNVSKDEITNQFSMLHSLFQLNDHK